MIRNIENNELIWNKLRLNYFLGVFFGLLALLNRRQTHKNFDRVLISARVAI